MTSPLDKLLAERCQASQAYKWCKTSSGLMARSNRACQKTVSSPDCSIGERIPVPQASICGQYGRTEGRHQWQWELSRPNGTSLALCNTRTASCLPSCSRLACYASPSLSNDEYFAMGNSRDHIIFPKLASASKEHDYYSTATLQSRCGQPTHVGEQQRAHVVGRCHSDLSPWLCELPIEAKAAPYAHASSCRLARVRQFFLGWVGPMSIQSCHETQKHAGLPNVSFAITDRYIYARSRHSITSATELSSCWYTPTITDSTKANNNRVRLRSGRLCRDGNLAWKPVHMELQLQTTCTRIAPRGWLGISPPLTSLSARSPGFPLFSIIL